MNTSKKSSFYTLGCVGCGATVAEKDSVTRCPICGEALQVIIEPTTLARRVARDFDKSAAISGLKYQAFYPLHDPASAITLGEGDTPLQRLSRLGAELKLPQLFVKNEGHNPTGVFKDRGSLVEISKARELRATAVTCASTGNMAASVSAYAAVAGLPCYVLIPEGTPLGKLAQSMSYGARVIQVRGSYGDCCRLSEEMAAKYGYYLAGDYVFRGEGQKTIAFEIVEQLGWRVPDWVVVPVGCGTNIAAIWQGFVEFHQLGLIETLPKMIGVQPAGCSTICDAFQKNKKKATIVTQPQTIATAVGIGTPLDDRKAIACLRASQGCVATVSEAALMQAMRDLGEKEAVFVEPSAALPLAALRQLRTEKKIAARDTVVLVATGAGLKDPKNALNNYAQPATIEPDMRAVDHFIRSKLYAIRSAGLTEKEKALFQKAPTDTQLLRLIKKEFDVTLHRTQCIEMQQSIAAFLAKGKSLKKSDVQHLLEDVLSSTAGKRIFEILDYTLAMTKSAPPTARVSVRFGTKKRSAETGGVGPVDAVIRALQQAIRADDRLRVRLTDYQVRIDDRGTDATVEVRMTLCDQKDSSVIATATSPDVITASIAAFEKGYNLLFEKGS